MAAKRALPPTHPGEILREDVLPALGLTVVDGSKLAAKSGRAWVAAYASLKERFSVMDRDECRLG